MNPKELKDMIREVATLITDHLAFELLKNVRVNGSVNSGSAYIYFDEIKIRISDHNVKGIHDYFIDVRKFLSAEQCFSYFVNNLLDYKNT